MQIKDLQVIFLPTKIYHVNEKLLSGNAIFSPVKMLKLKLKKVTKIIDLRNTEKKETIYLKKLEAFYAKIFGIKYENKPFYISTTCVPNQDFFDNLNQSILNNDGQTYLHCHYGAHRTNMAVANYEKQLGVANNEIVDKLIKNFLTDINIKKQNQKKQNQKNQIALDIFLRKFFPNKN